MARQKKAKDTDDRDIDQVMREAELEARALDALRAGERAGVPIGENVKYARKRRKLTVTEAKGEAPISRGQDPAAVRKFGTSVVLGTRAAKAEAKGRSRKAERLREKSEAKDFEAWSRGLSDKEKDAIMRRYMPPSKETSDAFEKKREHEKKRE